MTAAPQARKLRRITRSLLATAALLATACSSGGSGGGTDCGTDCESVASSAADDRFGSAVSVSGDAIAVGAVLDDDAGGSSGSAHVSRFDGMDWIDEQKLAASDGAAGDFFGAAVSASDDTIAVGAQYDDDAGPDSGSAYVYHFDGADWIEEQKLFASDAALGDFFGATVSASGDTVVVGAFLADYVVVRLDANQMPIDVPISDGGAAYVYRFDGVEWVEEQKLIPSDVASRSFVGFAVSVSGDTIVVGARGADGSRGSAYVYRFDGVEWVEEQKLVAFDAALNDFFGAAVSVSGDTIVVGAYLDDAPAIDSGSAYVYRFDGVEWDFEQKLVAADGTAGDYFGTSVSVSGDAIVAGSHLDDDAGPNSGSAYAYRFDGADWDDQQKLVASDAAAGDFFGSAVSVSGDTIAVGAQYDDDAGPDSGSVYVYHFDGMDWIEEQKLVSSDAMDDE